MFDKKGRRFSVGIFQEPAVERTCSWRRFVLCSIIACCFGLPGCCAATTTTVLPPCSAVRGHGWNQARSSHLFLAVLSDQRASSMASGRGTAHPAPPKDHGATSRKFFDRPESVTPSPCGHRHSTSTRPQQQSMPFLRCCAGLDASESFPGAERVPQGPGSGGTRRRGQPAR